MNKTRKSLSLITLVVVMLFFAGCAKRPNQVTINTIPPGATIMVNEVYQGKAPVKLTIEASKYNTTDEYTAFIEKQFTITAQKQGYFIEEQTIGNSRLADYGETGLTLKLNPSPMWKETVDTPLPNQWHYILVNQHLNPKKTWHRLVDTVTKRYNGITQLDPQSGYIESNKKQKSFKTVRGTFRLRSEFIAAIEQRKPIKYKMKIISEWTINGIDWNPYPRMFKEDALLIEEIRDRFAEK